MKLSAWYSLLLPFVGAAVIPREESKVDYTGYKVFRVTAADDTAAVEAQVSPLGVAQVASTEAVDVAVAPENIDAFNALGLDHQGELTEG